MSAVSKGFFTDDSSYVDIKSDLMSWNWLLTAFHHSREVAVSRLFISMLMGYLSNKRFMKKHIINGFPVWVRSKEKI